MTATTATGEGAKRMGILAHGPGQESPAPQAFKVRFAGGQEEPPHPEWWSRWYGVDAAGVLTVVTQAPEGTTTARYSPAAWEAVIEFVPDPTYRPPAAAAARPGAGAVPFNPPNNFR